MRTDPSELLRETQGLRRLAQRLARDGAAAEDLLQELWLRAWHGGPEDPERRGPWLVRVLTNLSKKQQRGERRRIRREQSRALAADAHSTPAADEIAERIEAQRLLLEALAALEEPFRSTLVLRFQDELTPAEIAQRLGIPPGTVRWRIHEGLSRLRARLDRHHGGRREWLLACAPLLVRAPTNWPLISGIGMNTSLKVGLAAAVVGLVALPVWISTRNEPALGAPAEKHEPIARNDELRAAPPAELRPAAPGEREAAIASEPAPESRESRATPTGPEPDPLARIEGRVLDERRRPLAAARAEVADRAGPAECDDEGRFELELSLSSETEPGLEVRVHAPACATKVVRVSARQGATVQLGDVELAAGARVAGRVTTAAGDPAPDVLVVVARPRADPSSDELSGPLLEPESACAASDADGWFEVEGAPAGMVSAWARRPSADATDFEKRSSWVRSAVFELAPNSAREDLEIVLPLEEGGFGPTAIAGSVVSPLGEPVPSASVRVEARMNDGGSIQTTVAADSAGRFVFDPRRPSVVELVARDPEETLRPARLSGVRGGKHDVQVVLQEPRWLEIAVHDASGARPAEFQVREIRVMPDGKESWPRAYSGSDGALRLSLPIDAFVLEIEAPGCALQRHGPFDPERAPATLDCELESMPGLRGRVTFEGKSVAGARLELRRYPTPEQHVESDGFPMKVWVEIEETATSDTDGRFLLTGRKSGERVIQCLADGYAMAELGPLDVDPARGAANLALELSRGGSIAGEVRTAPGVDPAGIIVAANRFDGHPRTVRADEAGRFRFEHLTPGAWRIERVKRELDPTNRGYMVDDEREAEDPRSVPNCTVADGQTTEFVLDLTHDRPAKVHVHLEVDGVVGASWSIVLWPVGVNTFEGELPGGRLDESGRLTCEVDPGRYYLRFQDGQSSAFYGIAELELDLAPGDTPLDVAFGTTSISGRYSGDPTGLIAVWSAQAAGGCRTQTYMALDAQGRFQRNMVLAGNGELRIQRREDQTVVAKHALELVAGEPATVELPQ